MFCKTLRSPICSPTFYDFYLIFSRQKIGFLGRFLLFVFSLFLH